MPEREKERAGRAALKADAVLVAYEKLFAGGRGVRRFARSGLRYVPLDEGAVLIEQNLHKQSEWAALARQGRRVAWVLRDGEYLARVVDGEVVMLGGRGQETEHRKQNTGDRIQKTE